MIAGCVMLLGLLAPSLEGDLVPAPPTPEPETTPEPEPEAVSEPEVTPEPEAVSEPETDDEVPRDWGPREPRLAEAPKKPPIVDPVRKGVVLSGMLGYAGCGKPWCQGYKAGFGGGFELGVRFHRIMPLIAWGGGIGPYDRATLEEEVGLALDGKPQVKMHVFGVGASLFPLGKETRRVDPHFGARIGYGMVRLNFSGEGFSATETVRRGVITLGGGLDGFVTHTFTLGVRADLHLMFGGKDCIEFRGDGGSSASACAASDDLESRVDPRDWPLPLSVILQLRKVWGF